VAPCLQEGPFPMWTEVEGGLLMDALPLVEKDGSQVLEALAWKGWSMVEEDVELGWVDY